MSTLARDVDRAAAQARHDPAAAVRALEALRRTKPGNPRAGQALRRIARAHHRPLMDAATRKAKARDWAGALAILQPLARVAPDTPRLAALTAEGLLATGEAAAARRLIEAALEAQPADAALKLLLGQVRRALGDTDGAISALDAAVASGRAEAGVALGLCRLELGDRSGAEAAWRATVAAAPQTGDAWMHLAGLIDIAADRALAAAMDAAATGRMSAQERVCLDFARGETALKAGETEAGFRHLARANAAHRAAIGYDPALDARLFATIRARFGDLQGAAPAGRATRVVFVTGLPRSGTTLVERILAAHPMVVAGGEREDLVHAVRPCLACTLTDRAMAGVADAYRAALDGWAGDTAVATDKMPLNFRWIGPALAAMPEARVVHVTREPMAVGLSIWRRKFAGGANAFAYGMGDIGAYIRLERDLMAFWRARWGGDRLFDLDYAALVADPEREIRRLLAFCRLPFDAACLAPHLGEGAVRTSSAAQVRLPIYRGSDVEWRGLAAAGSLAPLAAALGPEVAPDGAG